MRETEGYRPQLELLTDLEVSSLEPDEEILVVAANIRQN